MDTKLKVAFYIGKGKFSDEVIRWWTKSRYSHVELILDGLLFSADAWENRVRFTNSYNPLNWEIIDLGGLTDKQFSDISNFCNSQLGKKYDWLGVFGFVFPFIKQNSKKWFCSEICGAGLKLVGKVPVTTKTSKLPPQGLYDLTTSQNQSKHGNGRINNA